jgi:uncharacterized membrane protein YphA (DoxX/SURF4 family)
VLRLELIRILFPLAALGFLSGRLAHADELLGESGFHVPDLGVDDWRQPLYLPPLPDSVARLCAVATVLAGLALALGYRTRSAAFAFALLTAWIALSDRLAAFTVAKLSPVLACALFVSPAGARFSVDAWVRQKHEGEPAPDWVVSGALRFFQAFLVVFYCASGTCKARGEWLSKPYVLWTHVHDSYQTWVSWAIAQVMPLAGWTALQVLVLVLELFAPLWLSWKRTRSLALCLLLGMHASIGLMFGPVKWFALLMIGLLLACYLPERLLTRLAGASSRRLRRGP